MDITEENMVQLNKWLKSLKYQSIGGFKVVKINVKGDKRTVTITVLGVTQKQLNASAKINAKLIESLEAGVNYGNLKDGDEVDWID